MQKDEEIECLTKWILDNGGWINPKVEIKSIGSYRGVFAKEDLAPGERIVAVPNKMLITGFKLLQQPEFAIFKDPSFAPFAQSRFLILLLGLCCEKMKGKESQYYPLVRNMTEACDVDLCQRSDLAEIIDEDCEMPTKSSIFEQIWGLYQAFVAKAGKSPLANFSKDLLKWGFTAISTRCIVYPFASCIPYNNMFNHGYDTNIYRKWVTGEKLEVELDFFDTEYDNEAKKLLLSNTQYPEVAEHATGDWMTAKALYDRSALPAFADTDRNEDERNMIFKGKDVGVCYYVHKTAPVLKGQELLYCYSFRFFPYSNLVLLLNFSFATDDIKHNYRIYSVHTNDYLAKNAPALDIATENVKFFKFSEYLAFNLFPENLNLDLLLFLRCVYSGQKLTTKDPVSKETELKVLEKYVEICKSIMGSFKTTPEDDQKVLATCTDYKTSCLLTYKITVKKVMKLHNDLVVAVTEAVKSGNYSGLAKYEAKEMKYYYAALTKLH